MSIFQSPASVQAKPEPQPDPEVVAQRDAAKARANAEADRTGQIARNRAYGKTMGTQGANAMFTSGAAGYGRTMGAANI